MPQFIKEKQHFEFPNERALVQHATNPRLQIRKLQLTDKMKINKHGHYLHEKKIKQNVM